MEKEKKKWWSTKDCKPVATVSGGIYGLGLIGVFIYYLQHSMTITEGLIGLFKAVFWPAFLLFKVYTVLGM